LLKELNIQNVSEHLYKVGNPTVISTVVYEGFSENFFSIF